MSNCIKDLYDYDLVKKCSNCRIISLKSNFHKNKKSSDCLVSQCKLCIIQKQRIYDHNNRNKIHTRMYNYYLQKRDRFINRNKDYRIENHD